MMDGLTYPNYKDLTRHLTPKGKDSKGTIPRKQIALFQENCRLRGDIFSKKSL